MTEHLEKDNWRNVGLIAAFLVALTGLMVLIGWFAGIPALIQIHVNFAAMQFNTAMGMLAAGMARLFVAYEKKRPAQIAGFIILGLSSITLLEYFGIINWPQFDTMLWYLGANRKLESFTLLRTTHPGRMASNTALCLLLSSFSTFLIVNKSERFRTGRLITASVFGTFIISLSGISLFGYIQGTAPPTYWWAGFTTMSINTSICLTLLGFSTVGLAGTNLKKVGLSPATLLPYLAFTGGVVLTLGIAQGLIELAGERESLAHIYALVIGSAITIMMALTFRYALTIKHREEELRATNARLAVEIAERKLAEETLTKHTAELKRSNEELERFAYVASHDLQEPLRMVASYTQLLAQRYKGKLDKDADQFIHFAVDGAQRMQKLIQGLLMFSRAGSQPLQLKQVHLGIVLRNSIANLATAIHESKASINTSELPVISGDELQLTQVFQNLIGNAIKFQNGKTPEIRVQATDKGEYWEFAVVDNGIGIDPKNTDRIFQVFKRLHTHYEYPGTGIGLSLAKKIIERHGGQIRVESKPGEGATFFFTIPK